MRPAPLLGLLALAACGPALPREEPPPRVLLVGWDGASFAHFEGPLAEGRMPNLARLLERGVRAPLRSTAIPISSAAWPVIVTGKGPGQTGVYSFFENVPGSYEQALVSSRSVRAAPLWRILTRRGLPSITFGVPLTYPPEPVLGTLVAGMLSPFDADYAWPPGYADELRSRGFVPDLESWKQDWRSTWSDLEEHLQVKEEALLERMDGPWRLAFCVFKSPDVVGHKSYGTDLLANLHPVYERLDRILGALIERAGPQTDVLLVSDHGFRTYRRGFNLHAWLVAQGFATRTPGAASVLRNEGNIEEMMRSERADLLAELELETTRAYADRCEGNFGSLRLNLSGREPRGCVAPEDREHVLAELEAQLRAHPKVREVWRVAELYPGPHRSSLPELVFEVEEGIQVFAERGTQVLGDYPHPLHDHERMGVLVAAGPSFRHVPEAEPRELVDVAPLVLYLLHEPIPTDLEGELNWKWLRATHPVQWIPPQEESGPGLERAFTSEELQELQERLSSLGY